MAFTLSGCNDPSAGHAGAPCPAGDRRDVDVVYVATPHSAHRQAAGMCLEAGRHVLCEKALTLNAREA
ncbi:Gfo/Idh/MocA family oxidoreductase, partial [Streptomyces venezuelae]